MSSLVPYHSAPSLDLYVGDALAVLRTLPDGLAHCCVTSPPYFGLRDYGTAEWEGGDPACEHVVGGQVPDGKAPGAIRAGVRPGADATVCRACGAQRVDDQLGLEATPEEYVGRLVGIFRDVRRVLRPDGTLWLNLGDSYASDSTYNAAQSLHTAAGWKQAGETRTPGLSRTRHGAGLKSKDLVGVPWMVAFALRADGWWLRAENIWAKPNPMPESVTDRPTRSHEQVFLLSASPYYYYDRHAIAEPVTGSSGGDGGSYGARADEKRPPTGGPRRSGHVRNGREDATRNARSVWTINPQPYAGDHYAAFPEELARRCILAGTSEKGCCAKCGAPWRRIVEKGEPELAANTWSTTGAAAFDGDGYAERSTLKRVREHRTLDWQPSCSCDADVVPAVVLDPFLGSGTVALVAREHGRRTIGIDLNPDFAEQAVRRALGTQTRELDSDRRHGRDGTLSLFG